MLQQKIARIVARFSLTYPANPDLTSTGTTFKVTFIEPRLLICRKTFGIACFLNPNLMLLLLLLVSTIVTT